MQRGKRKLVVSYERKTGVFFLQQADGEGCSISAEKETGRDDESRIIQILSKL
jgi:hypothetical protein